jgi:hypothetical protein
MSWRPTCRRHLALSAGAMMTVVTRPESAPATASRAGPSAWGIEGPHCTALHCTVCHLIWVALLKLLPIAEAHEGEGEDGGRGHQGGEHAWGRGLTTLHWLVYSV